MTTNGTPRVLTVGCQRCETLGIANAGAYAEHLVEFHDMPEAQAKREARQVFGIEIAARGRPAKSTSEPVALKPAPKAQPITHDVPHHVCPNCEAKMPCPWEMIAQIEAQATRLKLLAANMTRRQMGLSVGAPRKDATWTDEDVVAAYKSGLSIKAIAGMYQAGQNTVSRALKRAGAK